MSAILTIVNNYFTRRFYKMDYVEEIKFDNGSMAITTNHPKKGYRFSNVHLFGYNYKFDTREFSLFLLGYQGHPEGFKGSFMKKFEVSPEDDFLDPYFFENIENYLRVLIKIGASRGGQQQRF